MSATKRYIEAYEDMVHGRADSARESSQENSSDSWYKDQTPALPRGRFLFSGHPSGDVFVPIQLHPNATEAAVHHRFQLLDSVFSSFVETNDRRGAHYSLSDILHLPNRHKTYFRYVQHDIPYLATVFLKDAYDGDWLNLKLNNDGFVYVPKRGHPVPRRHNCDGWVLLEPKDWSDMVSLCLAFNKITSTVAEPTPVYASSRVFYNWTESRIDLKIYSNDRKAYPNVLVTFERGSPYYDEEVKSSPFPL